MFFFDHLRSALAGQRYTASATAAHQRHEAVKTLTHVNKNTESSFLPFFNIARKYGVPYSDVLKLAELNSWWDASSELQIDVQRAVEEETLRRERVIALEAMKQ